MNDLHEEVIREILLRLPVKSLLRFRSVSKSWLSLISDTLFAKLHFELASSPINRLVYLTASQTRSIDVDASFHDDSAVAILSFPLTATFDDIHILGSCRGFLLLDDSENLFIWNPSTGSCKKLSYPPISSKYLIKHGLGYDCSTDDYMVVLAYNHEEGTHSHFEFFSLKNKSWGNFEGTHLTYVNPMVSSGIFLNGAIHWLELGYISSVMTANNANNVIVAFDLAQKNLRQLPPPDIRLALKIYVLGLHGGCLSISMVERLKTEIWVMKEYGLKSSWEKFIIVPIGETPTEYFKPKFFTKAYEIFGFDIKGLMKCNHEGVLLERFTPGHQEYGYKAFMYTECLLSLPAGVEGGQDMQKC